MMILIRVPSLAASLTALGGLVSAQAVAVHPVFATGEPPRFVLPSSGSQQGFPFNAGISRQMVVFGVAELRLPHGASIDALGFPRDDVTTTAAQTVDIRFRMGAAALPFGSASTQFDANWHGAPDEVFGSRTLSLPALTSSNEVVWVPFDHPYLFDRARDLVS